MARESALWDRMRRAIPILRERGNLVDLQRLENAVGTGHPDVEGCVNGIQLWIELKSEDRPKRVTTKIHPKVRDSQRDWHRDRCAAGCRTNFVLLQVGEAHCAKLYLVPGSCYERLIATEADLENMSCVNPSLSVADMILEATKGW